jgi:hypothetical protein
VEERTSYTANGGDPRRLVVELDGDLGEPAELAAVVASEQPRGDSSLVVHEIEDRELHADERLDPLEQLPGNRRGVVRPPKGGCDRRQRFELGFGDLTGGPAPAESDEA